MQQHNYQDYGHQPNVIEVDKFALRAFNCLAYDCKICWLLAASTLLGFPKYYTSEKSLKQIYLKALYMYFPKIICSNAEDEEVAKSFIILNTLTRMPAFVFDDYLN